MTDRVRVGTLDPDRTLFDTAGYTRTSVEPLRLHLFPDCICLPSHKPVHETCSKVQYDDSVVCMWCLFRSDDFPTHTTHPSGVDGQ